MERPGTSIYAIRFHKYFKVRQRTVSLPDLCQEGLQGCILEEEVADCLGACHGISLNDQSVSPEGRITRYPTLHNLDRGYDFMPRYGKQVSSWESVIPCLYRNYLCFAKVDF